MLVKGDGTLIWNGGRAEKTVQENLTKLAFIGFGEAAQAFVGGFGPAWAGVSQVYDIKTDHDEPAIRDGKRADYETAGVIGCATAAEALAGAPVVFSLVTADQALEVAKATAGHLPAGILYFDCNSCSPGSKRRAAELIDGNGGRYVDVAVMTPVYPRRHQTPLLVSGRHKEAALELMSALQMQAEPVEGPLGAAAAIKMVRSIMVKGMEALYMECVLTGRQSGVEEVVLDSLDDTFPGFGFKDRAAYMLERVMTHGVRRAAEMREVALTVEEAGQLNAMSRATVEWQQMIGDLGVSADLNDYTASADAVLAKLQSRGDAS